MFQDILKKLRKERNLTQKKIAEDLGISQPSYRQWESGARKPSGETLEKFADYFDVTTDFLLGRDSTQKTDLDKFVDELERRYDDIINLSFMNSDFFDFCIVIEEIALNSLRVTLGKKMNNKIVEDYSSVGHKRQLYLSSFESQIENKAIKASNIPNLKETILEQELKIASQYFK